MPQVAAAVEALDPVHVAKVMADGGEVGISVDGDEHTIGPDEVTLALQPLEGYEVEAEAGHAVALQLELDDELRREGLAREIVHAVQNARKAAGLDISDRIELALGGDDELIAAAREHEPYIAAEVLATSVVLRRRRHRPRQSRRPRPPDQRHKDLTFCAPRVRPKCLRCNHAPDEGELDRRATGRFPCRSQPPFQ